MEIKLKLGLNQVLSLIRQLSISEKRKIAKELQIELRSLSNGNDLQKLLLNGPTWTNKEYKDFLKKRNQLNNFPSNDFD
ncbi:MAG: hypothetical protein ABI855_05855 [Bacteroidota bacterium]